MILPELSIQLNNEDKILICIRKIQGGALLALGVVPG